jgi:acetate kinase
MVVVFNVGSSSIKYSVFEDEVLQEHSVISEVLNYKEALQKIIDSLDLKKIDYIVHRVVHGGEFFTQPTRIDAETLEKLQSISFLAPLHNPHNILPIEYFLEHYPSIAQVAVFDTAFHTTMPPEAYMYAIDKELAKKHHIRRYGFHGFSHAYLLHKASAMLQKQPTDTSLITIHLGNGASICAIEDGKSIDTSMGMTPLEGLVMGSRCGDIDPGVVLYLQKEVGLDFTQVDLLLNKRSGLQGLCGTNEMQKIIHQQTDEIRLGLDVYIRRILKYIGAYMVLLKNVDGIVFSGGIGENSSYIRAKILQSLEKFGILTDYEANKKNDVMIHKKESNVAVFVIKTNEELEMLRSAKKVMHG